jgi:hypothetical protein
MQRLQDLFNTFQKWELSEKQVAYAQSLVKQAQDGLVKAKAEKESKAELPELEEGRRLLAGTVVSLKDVTSDYGTTTKMLVTLDSGHRVWGTVPSGMPWDESKENGGLPGAKVQFTATVQRSSQDRAFGFFSRPTKPSLA